MGCAASKLGNDDTVRRCKDRRRLITEAVHSRHHLSAAHSDYCRSLRRTGAALSSFAAGEPLAVSPHTPSVHVATTAGNLKPEPSFSSYRHTRSPTDFDPPPVAAAKSASRRYRKPDPVKLLRIPSESTRSRSDFPQDYSNAPPPGPASKSASRRYRKPDRIKLPHILSESSPSSSPRNPSDFPPNFTYKANSIYSNTPSQASSVWNWENFYPPSPPNSEFFENRNRREADGNRSERFRSRNGEEDDRDRASLYSDFFDKSSIQSERFAARNHGEDTSYSDFFDRSSNKDNGSVYSHSNKDDKSSMRSEQFHNRNHKQDDSDRASVYSGRVDHRSFKQQRDQHEHHLDVEEEEEEEEETEREEVQYSEWDDHCNTSSSSSSEGDERESSRSEIRSNFGASVRADPRAVPPPAAAVPKYAKSEKALDDGASTASWNAGVVGCEISNDMRMVVRHKDLAEIVAAIREYFDKAASAGEQVGVMLETGRAQLDRSFSKLKKTVYHSSGVFSNLSSSWTSKPPLAVKYQFEPSSLVEPSGPKSLCSTLERLLAWEKKLYQEVKAREGVKIEHEKKLSSLQSQEYRGGNEAKLDKTKTEIKRLQSLIVVTSQAVSTTSSAIIGVRDAELVPQLVELCHGFMYMWRSMNQFHEVQNQIVQQVRGLVNRSMKGESTSDLHRQATRDLESAVSGWHSSFCRLIKFQRDFICSLHGWFKLTLVSLNNEPINGNTENSEAFSFYDQWKLALDRLPDTVASEAIKSFINVVHSISMKQAEELKIKKRTESVSKELEKKASSLRNIEKKFYHSYSMVGIGLPDTGPDNGHVLDARDPLADKKFELEGCRRRVEDEMLRHSKAVEVTRAMTLNNIQTGLPGVFQAMTSFSACIMEALETVCTHSYAIK